MRRRWPIILCLGVAVLFLAGYFLLARSNQSVDDDHSRVQIAAMKAEDIAGIYYEYTGESYEFKKEGGDWSYVKDPDFSLDPSFITSMANRLADIVSTMRVGDISEENYANFGFDNPTLSIKVSTFGGEMYEYKVGSYNEVISRYYFLAGDEERIHVVEQGFVKAFSLDLYDMILMDVPPDFFTSAVTGFEICKDGETTRFDYYKDGREDSYSSLIKWFITNEDVANCPADTAYVTNLLAYTGAGMVFDRCVSYGAGQEDEYARFGLDDPVIVSVDYLDASMSQSNIKYYIGDRTGEQYYVTFSGSDKVFLTSKEIAETLMQTDPEAFGTDAVTLIELDTVERLTLECENEKYVFDVVCETAESADGTGKAKFALGGVEISSNKMREFYNTFFHVDAERVLPSPVESGEAAYLTIDFERNTGTFDHMKLEFIPYDANFYLVRFNGRSDQLLGIKKVEMIRDAARLLAKQG